MSISKKYLIEFTKMHGCGNDFVVFETKNVKALSSDSSIDFQYIAQKISNRKLGVGCDQLIIINSERYLNDEQTHYEMLIYNADGSQASMCGNGVRCFSKYVVDNSIVSRMTGGVVSGQQLINTLAGTIKTSPTVGSSDVETINVKVDMGAALVLGTSENRIQNNTQKLQIDASKETYQVDVALPELNVTVTCVLVSMGNPHCVLFFDKNSHLLKPSEFETMDISRIAVALQKHPLFLAGCNVEFALREAENSFKVRVYENGSGETLACGTGACGVAVATVLCAYSSSSSPITISMPGGDLFIEWNGRDSVFKTGPACTVFKSSVQI